MKRLFTTLLVFGFFSTSLAQVKVTYDYDNQADFASYNTYKFTKEAMELPVNDLNRKRLLDAVSNQLSAKGFSASDNPDVWVDISVSAQQKEGATATTGYYGSGYRYRWGGGFSTTTINTYDYIEGTIFIDLIDASSKQLVWQGRGVGTVSESVKPEKREQRIKKGVAKIFKKYPPASK
ncbi:MAG: DUF4136 domain-containing protein [Cyclobacteriaceae bacterium]|nr:DUF4136 domain-containing protein [Cyclobacteriaceae bacterium]